MGKKINLDIQVIDRDMERPIRGALVTLKGDNTLQKSSAEGGKATFAGINEGLYLVHAAASGYKESVFSLGLKESGSFSVQLARSQLPF